MSASVAQFAKRRPATGRAYPCKEGLAYTDPGGMRLGVDEAAMSATFTVTTEAPDRVGDVVLSSGIDLRHYRTNPIFLYDHGMDLTLPIGKAEDPQGNLCVFPDLVNRRTIATCFFSQRIKEAEQIFALVVEKILRATSIGFNPLSSPVRRSSQEPNDNSLEPGYLFERIDLLEISVVRTPAQPQATLLRSILSKNRLAGYPIAESIRKSLEPLAAPRVAQAPGWTPPEVKTDGPHSFSSTQFNLRDAGYSRSQGDPLPYLAKMATRIPDSDLAADGREADFHITVKYGLHTQDAEDVRRVIEGFGPVRVKLGKVSLFPAKETDAQRDVYDVVKVDVEGEDIHRLNKIISESLEHTDTHPQYSPHVTLAYVKPGLGSKYTGKHPAVGHELIFDHLSFSPNEGEPTDIALLGNGGLTDMSKKWKKAPLPKKDALAEGSGTAGGYTVPTQRPRCEHEEGKPDMKTAIAEVMRIYEDQAPPEGPHDAYHDAKGSVYHQHAAEAPEEYLKAVRGALGALDDVREVAQHHEPPGEGYEKVYTRATAQERVQSMEKFLNKWAGVVSEVEAEGEKPSERALVDEIAAKLFEKFQKEYTGSLLVAPPAEKAFNPEEDYESKEDLDAAGLEDVADPMATAMAPDMPPGQSLVQAMIDLIESRLPQQEEEKREYFEECLAGHYEWAQENYPDAGFGGEASSEEAEGDEDTEKSETPEKEEGEETPDETAEDTGDDAQEEEETEEALDRYRQPAPPKSRKPRRKGFISVVKSLGRKAMGCIKEAADHLHEVAGLEPKMFGPRHQKKALEHGRALDALHGAVNGVHEQDDDPEPEKKPDLPPPDAPAALDEHDAAMKALAERWGAMDATMARIDEAFYRATGKRCS